jgi:hypothetical protein
MFPLWFAFLNGSFVFWTWVLPFCYLYSSFFWCYGWSGFIQFLVVIFFFHINYFLLNIWNEFLSYNYVKLLYVATHFEGSVRSPLTLPKMGLGSPPGLLKTQSAIVGVKTPRIEAFFIPLERSWSLDVQNGLAWAIWTSAAQVMVERRARSQTGSLTPDH